MKIRLNEIPEEGRQYDFNRNTAELNEPLKDLIADKPYKISLFVKALNTKDYTMMGSVKTEMPTQCSRCGEDFDLGVDKRINEILIPAQDQDRTSKYAKSSVKVTDDDSDVSVSEYNKLQFDLGDFLHEAIALEIPFTPHCADCLKPGNDKPFIYDEKMSEDVKPSPFSALKGIKLN